MAEQSSFRFDGVLAYAVGDMNELIRRSTDGESGRRLHVGHVPLQWCSHDH